MSTHIVPPCLDDLAAAIALHEVWDFTSGGSGAALPAVCDAVAGRCELPLNSAIRWGTDVFRALAISGSGTLLGRPGLWGLAADDENGVRRANAADEELRTALALADWPDLTPIR